jgi:hypothetical protein
MTERLNETSELEAQRERTKHLLEGFKPRSSETYDERVQPEDLDKILDAIKADTSLTDEERELLMKEAVNRYDRTANLPVYAHMGM